MLPDLCVLALGYAACCLLRRPKKPGQRVLDAVLYSYFCGILAMTLLPLACRLPAVAGHTFTANLHPFRDLLRGWGDSVGQILLNMLLFLPFGVLVPLRTGRGLAVTFLQAAVCSAAIELLQPFFDRTCDITDFITNVLGCACGYLLGLPLRPVLQQWGRQLDP